VFEILLVLEEIRGENSEQNVLGEAMHGVEGLQQAYKHFLSSRVSAK
jgi:hypothetical protein